ncbi:MAG: hypothetical protein WA816_09380 [Bacteroidales bacterium]
MVTITSIEQRKNPKTQAVYTVAIITGNLEILTSHSTGKPYLTTKSVMLPTTLNNDQAKLLVGQNLSGNIEKIECKPYDIKLANGKKISINHTYQFSPVPESK